MQANMIAESSCAGALAALLPRLRLILSAHGVLPAQVPSSLLFNGIEPSTFIVCCCFPLWQLLQQQVPDVLRAIMQGDYPAANATRVITVMKKEYLFLQALAGLLTSFMLKSYC